MLNVIIIVWVRVKAAILNSEGTVTVEREEWIIAEMKGSREGRQDLTRTVGSGSSWQVEDLELRMRVEISRVSGSWKLESSEEERDESSS